MADFARLTFKIDATQIDQAKKALDYLGLSASTTAEKTKQLNNATNNTSKAMGNFQKSFSKFAGGLSTFSNQMNAYVTLPLIGAGVAAVKMSTDLNKGLANVSTLIPGQTEELLRYKDAMKAMAVETGKSFDDLTRGLYEVISAFPGTREAIQITELAAKTARAGLSTTKQALDLLSATTKAYGDTSADAQKKVADMAFAAVKYGQTTFLDVAGAIQTVTERSQALGVSQEELYATFATFTGVTGDAAMVSTQLRSALVSLTNPTVELQALFEQINVKSGKELIERFGGLQGALKFINDYAEQNNMSLQKLIRRIEGITLTGSIATNMADTFAEKLELVSNSSGSMEEAFEQATEGIYGDGFRMEQAYRRIQVALTELGDVLVPQVAEWMTVWSEFALSVVRDGKGINTFLVEFGKNTVVFLLAAKGLSVVLNIFTSLSSALAGIGVIVSGGALAAGAGGLLALTGAIAAIVATKEPLEDTTEIIRGFADEMDYLEGVSGPTEWEKTSMAVDNIAEAFGKSNIEVMELLLASDDITKSQRELLGYIQTAAVARQLEAEAIKEQESSLWRMERLTRMQGRGTRTSDTNETQMPTFLDFINQDKAALRATLDFTTKARGAFKDFEEYTKDKMSSVQKYIDQYQKKVDSIGQMDIADQELPINQLELKQSIDMLQYLFNIMEIFENQLGSGSKKPAIVELGPFDQAVEDLDDGLRVANRLFDSGFFSDDEFLDSQIAATERFLMSLVEMGASDEYVNATVSALEMLRDMKFDKMVESLDKVSESFIRNAYIMGETVTETGRLRAQITATQNVLSEGIGLGKSGAELSELSERLAQLKKDLVFSELADGVKSVIQDNVIGSFNDLGKALSEASSSTEAFKMAFADMIMNIITALPTLLINAGLQLVAAGQYGPGLALVGLGLAGQVFTGYMQAEYESAKDGGNNANGGVFASGGYFTNSLVNTPTKFAFADGVGLMGEAGPEAIMPLTRTQDGTLGVRSTGGDSAGVIVNVINNADNSEVSTRERETSSGKEIDVIITSKVNQVLSSGSADGPMKSRYGVTPKGFR